MLRSSGFQEDGEGDTLEGWETATKSQVTL